MALKSLTYIENKTIVKSDHLDINLLSTYNLDMLLSPYEFTFCVYDPENRRCLRLESYIFPETYIPGKNDSILYDIFEDNQLLLAAFWQKINLFISNRTYTFVPENLYSEEIGKQLLAYNCGWNEEKENIKHVCRNNEMEIVYGFEKSIELFFNKIYPNRSINIKTFVINLLTESVSNFENRVVVYQNEKMLTVTAFKDKKFKYCNTFLHKNLDDMIYYIMLVYKELGFSPQRIPTIISGNSENLTILQSRLFKYVQNVQLASRPKGLKMCYKFDQIEESRFLGILNASHRI